MASESYTIKEMLQVVHMDLKEFQKESNDKLQKVEQHLAQLNSKVATHEQRLNEGDTKEKQAEGRLSEVEKRMYIINGGIIVVTWALSHFFF